MRLNPVAACIVAAIGGAVGAPSIVLVLGFAGWLPFDAISPPPSWETAVGQRALIASVDNRALSVADPLTSDDTEVRSGGGKLYANDCAGCHGSAKAPSKWGAEDFYPRVPQFWLEPISLRPEQAYVIIRDGIRYSGMGSWRHLLSDKQMWEVANFVSRIPDRSPRRAGAAASTAP